MRPLEHRAGRGSARDRSPRRAARRRSSPAPPARPDPPRARRTCGSSAEGDARLQTQPHQPGGGEDDHVGLAIVELAQAGVDVAAQRHHLEIGAQLAQQARAPGRRRAHPGAGGDRGERRRTARSTRRAGSSRSGTAPSTGRRACRRSRSFALCTAASIRPSSSARSISRVNTPRPSPIWSNRASLVAVTGGRDRHDLATAQQVGHQPGLRQRQRAAAAAQLHAEVRSSPNSSVTACAYISELLSAAACLSRTVGPVQELGQHRAGDRVEPGAVGLREALPAALGALELGRRGSARPARAAR